MERIDALFVRAPRFYIDGITGVIFPEEALYPTILEKNGFIARFLNPEIVERRFQPQLYPKKDAYVSQDKLLTGFTKNENHPRWKFLSFYIKKLMPKMVFISHRHPSDFSVTLKTAEIIKRIDPNLLTISIHLTSEEAKIYLENSKFIDICIFGEPEYTILEIMKEYKKGNLKKIRKIKGLVIRKNEKIIPTEKREIERNLDKFPIPDRDLVIRKEWFPPSAFGIVEIGRGCIYSCNFCGIKPPLRLRSPELVVKEIMMIMKKYKTRDFKLAASSLLHNKEWIKKFCEIIKKKKLEIVWGGFMNINQIEEEIIKLMKSSGFIETDVGIESGSVSILNEFNKLQNLSIIGSDYNRLYKKIAILKRNKILWRSGVIFGLPEENLDDLKEDIKILRTLKPDFLRFQFLVPKVGTIWFKKVNKENKNKTISLDKLHTGYSFFKKGKEKKIYYSLWEKMEKVSSISEKNYLIKRFLKPKVLFLKTTEYFYFLKNLFIYGHTK